MSDTPPAVKQVFVVLAANLAGAFIAGIVLGEVEFSLNFFACMATISLPILFILVAYKMLEKQRKGKDPKKTVQRLGLDD